MVYELAVVLKATSTDEVRESITAILTEVTKNNAGQVVIADDWGVRTMAQPTSSKVSQGRYLYYLYTAQSGANQEILRRLGINEYVLKKLIVKLGEDQELDKISKGYRTPFSKRYHGSCVDEENNNTNEEMGEAVQEKRFSKNRSCWFSSKGIKADWKDPATYAWIINDFGKIAPARVSGITRKNQKIVCDAIKRARQIGVASFVSSTVME